MDERDRRDDERFAAPPPAWSRARPVRRLAVLIFASFGLYQFYWFWRSWRDLETPHPGWRTAGLFVPFLNFYLVYDFFRTVQITALRLGIAGFSAVRAFLAFIGINLFTTAVWLMVYRWKPKGIGESLSSFLIDVLLLALQILPLVYVQGAMNAVWSVAEPRLPVRVAFNRAEIILVGACLFLWWMNLFGLFVTAGG
jgi:hypothetical protein